ARARLARGFRGFRGRGRSVRGWTSVRTWEAPFGKEVERDGGAVNVHTYIILFRIDMGLARGNWQIRVESRSMLVPKIRLGTPFTKLCFVFATDDRPRNAKRSSGTWETRVKPAIRLRF